MFKDTLHTGHEVRAKLVSGINKVADAVGATMGTGGGNAILEKMESPGHIVTNDGYSIAEAIHFSDPIEEKGRVILMEAISKANKASGDGSSTTTVLTRAILNEGQKYKEHPMDIKRSLEACLPLIEGSLNRQKRKITVEEVGQVASVSAEDEQIGVLIQEIYQKIGKDGIIHWDISKTSEDSYTIGQGLTVEGATLASPYMYDQDKTTGRFQSYASMKNPVVIVTREKITTGAIFEKLFVNLNNKGKKEVVIFCEDYDVTSIAHLVMTYQAQGFRAIVIKIPTIWNDEWREDLCIASGATLIDPSAGLSLKDIKEEHLGTFENIKSDKEVTQIDGIKDMSGHINGLEEQGTDVSVLRASRLNTKTARLYIGAHSESALSYKRLKVEDAISAAYHALQNGIVAGGGIALVQASLILPNTVGGDILRRALRSPFLQIVNNAGIQLPKKKWWKQILKLEPSVVIGDGIGYNTKTSELVDMFEAGITDPTNIVLNAVKSALSVSATILTANTLVLLPRQEENV